MFHLFNQPVLFFVGKPSKDKDSLDYVPSIFVFKGTKLNHQKLSRYERFLVRKTQRETSEHEEHETSSTAHCGEVILSNA